MDVDNAEINEEMKDSEAGKTVPDDDDDDDANMICEDDSKQDPPDHIKLVMEVRIFTEYSLKREDYQKFRTVLCCIVYHSCSQL